MDWIRTETRLPPDNTWVIMTVKDSRGRRYVIFGYRAGDTWYSTDDYPLEYEPEYWMPRPDPPGE